MTEPLAYKNGQLVPASQISISVVDAGFMQGVTVAEQVRTFGGNLFRLEEHLGRLAKSLDMIGLGIDVSPDQLAQSAGELVEKKPCFAR